MSMIDAMGSGYIAKRRSRETGNIGDADYGFDDLGQDWSDGVAQAFNQPTTAEKDAALTLQDQFRLMGEAYRHYRGLNADQQVSNLNAMLGIRAPVRQALNLMMPGLQQIDTGALQQSLGNQAYAIKDNAGLTGGQGPVAASRPWPVVHQGGEGANAPPMPPRWTATVLDPNSPNYRQAGFYGQDGPPPPPVNPTARWTASVLDPNSPNYRKAGFYGR